MRVPTMFSKNRQRLIEHDAVVAFFNEVLQTAENKDWSSGELQMVWTPPTRARPCCRTRSTTGTRA